MTMAQTQEFDFEVVEKLRTVIDFGNDSVLAKLKRHLRMLLMLQTKLVVVL